MNSTLKNIGAAAVVLFISSRVFARSKATSSNTLFTPINSYNNVRDCDPLGCGYFGASRGDRSHQGIDFIVTENQSIRAPFDCKVLRYGYPYTDDSSYRLVEIQGTGKESAYTAKVMYIKPTLPVGATVKKGAALCKADSLARKFGPTMTPHVHFELRYNGLLIDPTAYFV